MRPALLVSSSTPGYGIARALGMMGVPVVLITYDQDDVSIVSKYLSASIVAPHPEKGEKQFVELLLDISKMYSGGLLIPGSDPALAAISRNREVLSRYYNVACHEWGITKLFLDKMYTYQLAEKIGVPAPRTLTPACEEDVIEYGKKIAYPCLVKPRQVHRFFDVFKKKMFRAENSDELLENYQKTKVMAYDVVIQEFIPGGDKAGANYNSYFWDGEPLVEFTAMKIRNAPPLYGAPRVVVSQDLPEVIEPGRKILKALGFNGFSCTEFKLDPRDGVYKLMEVNGRHNLSSILAVHCGLNFPYIQYKHLMENEMPVQKDWDQGVYWIDFLTDLLYTAKAYRQERYPLSQYIVPYTKPHVFADLDIKDLRPFMKRLANANKRAYQNLAGKVFSGS